MLLMNLSHSHGNDMLRALADLRHDLEGCVDLNFAPDELADLFRYLNKVFIYLKNRTMWLSILVYLVYYSVYTVLLAIAGLWCFEECALSEEEEYQFYNQHRASPY